MDKIKRIKLFVNDNDKSYEIAQLLEKKLLESGFEISDDFTLGIAIGGDGSFLRMVKNTNFNDEVYYIGINTGHLGFLQEIRPNEIENFILNLINEKYYIDTIGIQNTIVIENNKQSEFNSLNEILIYGQNFESVKLDIYIGEEQLEKYFGDGLIICTSTGSTAHNLSYNGAIVHHKLNTLQLTTLGAINNNIYPNISNSIILPETEVITIIPETSLLNIRVDGDDYKVNATKIITTGNKRIKILRMHDYSLTKKINSKFILN